MKDYEPLEGEQEFDDLKKDVAAWILGLGTKSFMGVMEAINDWIEEQDADSTNAP